jgi:hypothetical protein
MTRNADRQVDIIMADLYQRFTNGEDVFVAVQKGVRQSIAGFKPKTFTLRIGHFGEFPGSNEFQDCSVAVIAGNPFRSEKWASQQIVAAEGPPSNSAWREHRERRRDIIEGVLAADLIQACNRISIRRATQPDGGCDPAEVFMILPADGRGDRLLEAVVRAMPGIDHSEEWKLKGSAKIIPKRTEYEAQLIEAIGNLKEGRTDAEKVRAEVGIPRSDFYGLLTRIKKGSLKEPLVQAMGRRGAVYQAAKGRGKRACFKVEKA